MKKAVIIPSYKAGHTLPEVIKDLPQELWDEGSIAVIINDCSPDDTGEVADQLAAEYPGVHAVHHEVNQGYGGALKTGFRYGLEQGAEICPVVHSDGQYAPEMAVEICRPIELGQTEIVQGSRMRGGARHGENPMPFWTRYLPNRALTIFENLVVGTSLAEFHSGYMIFSKALLEGLPYEKLQNNYNFDAEMIILAHHCGIRTVEVPIPTKYDDDTSSLNPIPYGLNVLRMMWRVSTGHYRGMLDDFTAEGNSLINEGHENL